MTSHDPQQPNPATTSAVGAAPIIVSSLSPAELEAAAQSNAEEWLPRGVLGFDTETTGTNVTEARIVTAALVLRAPGTDESRSSDQVSTWLINPGVDIPQAATDVHGITTQHAREHGADPRTALNEIADAIATQLSALIPLVAFNAGFDIRILEVELQRHHLPTLQERLGRSIAPVIDPLVLDRKVDRFRKGQRTLGAMSEVYGVPIDEALHDAHVDVAATLSVLNRIFAKHSNLAQMSLLDLHHYQIQAHREWADNFVDYLKRQNKPTDGVALTWPL